MCNIEKIYTYECALDFYLSNRGYSELCQKNVNGFKTMIQHKQVFPITPTQWMKNTEFLRRLYCEELQQFLINNPSISTSSTFSGHNDIERLPILKCKCSNTTFCVHIIIQNAFTDMVRGISHTFTLSELKNIIRFSEDYTRIFHKKIVVCVTTPLARASLNTDAISQFVDGIFYVLFISSILKKINKKIIYLETYHESQLHNNFTFI